MDIRNTRALKAFAGERVASATQEKKIVWIFSGLVMGLTFLTVVIRYILGLQISNLGGLSNMGTRSVLSAVQTMLPLLQSLVVMCLELGYTAAMLRIARGQYSSPQTLRLGFDRFWTLLRCSVIQGLIYAGLGIISVYLASILFMFSPFGKSFLELAAPMISASSLLSPTPVVDETMILQLIPTMIPMFVMAAIVACIMIIPVMFRFRMVRYIIIDKPGLRAMAVLRESRKIMKGNCLKLLKLDLSYWWYFAVFFGISMAGNADQWLPMVGVKLPMSAEVAYFLFYALYLGLQMAGYCFLRNRYEVTYGLAYDALKPEEAKDSGVVLGNIFQM